MDNKKTIRPWGNFLILAENTSYKVKRITIYPSKRISYQFHNKRSEIWTVVSGKGLVTLNDIEKNLNYGDSIEIPAKSKHRIHNKSKENLVFIEVQTGKYFGEDDIVRLDDDYKRV